MLPGLSFTIGRGSQVVSTSIKKALEEYDQEHAFAQLVIPPEEDRARLPLARWEGGYRWFRAPNIICLEKARRLRANGRI
jgi:hypothetical protein